MPRLPSSCRRPSPGFSLLEAVITLFLVSLVFLLAGDLLGSASRIVSFGQARNTTLEAMQQALQRLTSEARESYGVSASATEVSLQKVDPSFARIPDPNASTWNPYEHTLTVRYYVSGSTLLREVSGVNQSIAEGIGGLSAQVLPNGNLQVSLSLVEDKVIHTLTSEVLMPAVLPP